MEVAVKQTTMPPAPIFVVGIGRSGTTLVQAMLAAHPRLVFPPETAFLRRFVARGVLAAACRRGGVTAAVDVLHADERFNRTGLDAAKLVETALTNGCLADVAVYKAMLASFVDSQPDVRLGDKDPRAIEYLGHVQQAFPTCDVVHVIRDPRDILLSKKKAAWSKQHSTIRHLLAGRIQLRIGQIEGRRLFPGHYHEVIYERLLENPKVELERLCKSLDLEFDSAMLSFATNAASLVASAEIPWKKEVLGPLLRNNMEKWKIGLSDREIVLTELVCERHFAAGLYQRSDRLDKLTTAQRIGVYAEALTIKALEPIYRAHRSLSRRKTTSH